MICDDDSGSAARLYCADKTELKQKNNVRVFFYKKNNGVSERTSRRAATRIAALGGASVPSTNTRGNGNSPGNNGTHLTTILTNPV